MSDLPDIKNGASSLKIGYSGEPQSHFQRLVSTAGPIPRPDVGMQIQLYACMGFGNETFTTCTCISHAGTRETAATYSD